eukprot:7416921-Pyramimonas_sp.AAC.1
MMLFKQVWERPCLAEGAAPQSDTSNTKVALSESTLGGPCLTGGAVPRKGMTNTKGACLLSVGKRGLV